MTGRCMGVKGGLLGGRRGASGRGARLSLWALGALMGVSLGVIQAQEEPDVAAGAPGDAVSLGESAYFEATTARYFDRGEAARAVALIVAPIDTAEDEALLEAWRWKCEQWNWSLAVVGVQSQSGLPPAKRREAGSWLQRQISRWVAEAQTSALAEGEELPRLPMIAYAQGEGADWLMPEWVEGRSQVRAWAVKGGRRFPKLKMNQRGQAEESPSAEMAPGFLIGTQGTSRGMREFVVGLRQQDLTRRLAFFASQGNLKLNPEVEDELALQFLKAAMRPEPEAERWVHADTGAMLTAEVLEKGQAYELANYLWFPDGELHGAWDSLCVQRTVEPPMVVKMFSKYVNRPPQAFDRIEFHHNKLGKERKGILLFAIDDKRPQSIFQSAEWIDFAREQGWAVLVFNIRKGERIKTYNKAVDYLDGRLFQFIDEGPFKALKDLPIVWIGEGRPAYWMQHIMIKRPERFAAWAAEGTPEFVTMPQGTRMPPGLIVAPKPELHFPSLFYLQDLRKVHQANRVCLLANGRGNLDQEYVDEFTQLFLEGVAKLGRGNGFWWRYRDSQPLTLSQSQQGVDPADYVWFPNQIVAGTWQLLSRERPQVPVPTIEQFTLETRVEEIPELSLYLRIPGSVDKNSPREIKGVMCFCTWQQEDTTLLNRLKRPDDHLVALAERNDLAMITWNTASLVPRGTSIFSLDEEAMEALSAKYDEIGEYWLKAIEKVCRDHKLPRDNFFLHGQSRGSVYANRIALRHPDKFLAVHTHIGAHYEEPVEEASNVIWLVTTGEIDGGYTQSRQFFLKGQEQGFPMMIKAGPSLGHRSRDDIELLSHSFFEYVLNLRDRADLRTETGDEGTVTPADLFREDLEKAPYFGDFINHEVYPKDEGEWVPEGQRIKLPNETMANAWGMPPAKES
ncbi:MAG: hypothetical protein HRU46_18710 [Verrucomicrobiales bacterium]|nr:hypothetical protein [Verrucomicrobiales bacterium]